MLETKRDAILARMKAGPIVMGILNVTPDSFSDGGRYEAVGSAVAQAEAMVADGAAILDIGGESTRPGADKVDEPEELRRVIPVIEALADRVDVPISIDTYKANVARAAVGAGATIINDIWGLQGDPDMAAVAAETGAAVVAMYNRDTKDPDRDILSDMEAFFETTLQTAANIGINREYLILDPGVGFGKLPEQNLQAIAGLDRLKRFDLPVLLGTSRKSFIGKILHDAPVDQRLVGSLTTHLVGIQRGASVLRVHDVKEHVQMLKVLSAFAEVEKGLAV